MCQGSVYALHNSRLDYIKSKMPDYEIIEIWEHEWDWACKNDETLKSFLKENEILDPINLRHALSGGRTNSIKLYYNCKPEEMIMYFDYTSLYPFVQKYGEFPDGHPRVITENFDENFNYFGLIRCKILPPKGLYIPVLPHHINKKLVFTLCRTYAEFKSKDRCDHNDEQRAITGLWVSLEIKKAIEKGYKILKYYEVWHWDRTEQYNCSTKEGGLFTGYINAALKEKQEADGYPANVTTDEEKDAYIKDYYDHEGILLEKSKIVKNKGRKSVAKLKANSQWGYLAMNLDKTQFKIINDLNEWNSMLVDNQYIIKNVDFVDESSALMVQYGLNKDFFISTFKTNVVLAAFVTCHARLVLYSELEKLNERVLYFDTDSIIFVTRPGDYVPPTGNYLGDFKNEISEGYIQEFVSAGPKNYAYRLNNGKTKCTIKGFTQNYLASLKITFDEIKHIVCEEQEKKIQVEQLKFKRNKKNQTVQTNVEMKKYGFVYDKRVLFEDLSTLPYGF